MENNHLSAVVSKCNASNWKEKSLEHLRKFSHEKTLPEPLPDLITRKEDIEKQLAELLHEVEQVKKELNLQNEDDENFIQEKCKLYEKISNITWDLNSLPSDVRGYISDPFNVFHLNTETHSEFDISNYLWKLISGEKENLPVLP